MLILFKFEFFCFGIFKDNLLESVHLLFGVKKMFGDRNILLLDVLTLKIFLYSKTAVISSQLKMRSYFLEHIRIPSWFRVYVLLDFIRSFFLYALENFTYRRRRSSSVNRTDITIINILFINKLSASLP